MSMYYNEIATGIRDDLVGSAEGQLVYDLANFIKEAETQFKKGVAKNPAYPDSNELGLRKLLPRDFRTTYAATYADFYDVWKFPIAASGHGTANLGFITQIQEKTSDKAMYLIQGWWWAWETLAGADQSDEIACFTALRFTVGNKAYPPIGIHQMKWAKDDRIVYFPKGIIALPNTMFKVEFDIDDDGATAPGQRAVIGGPIGWVCGERSHIVDTGAY